MSKYYGRSDSSTDSQQFKRLCDIYSDFDLFSSSDVIKEEVWTLRGKSDSGSSDIINKVGKLHIQCSAVELRAEQS